MNIHQIVPQISEEASGPSHTVPALCEALSCNGHVVTLHVLGDYPLQRRTYEVVGYHCLPCFGRVGWSPAMWQELAKAAEQAHIFHNHSLWMLPNVYPGKILRNNPTVKFVLSPRGTLSNYAWARSRWKKGLMWYLGGQGACMRRVDCFHATAEEERDDLRRLGFRQPVAIIPNGVYIPDDVGRQEEQGQRHGKFRRLLFLSRIHPKKNVDVLLRAWQQLESRFPEWELYVVGPDNVGYLNEMKRLAADLLLKRVIFPGPVYGSDKHEMFFSADLYVLPTHSENFGISVAEALAHGVPAIVTRGAPWSGLNTQNCGWWIDHGEDALVSSLTEAMALPREQLMAMGARGRDWMVRDFSWQTIGAQMANTYQWLLGGGSKPAWVDEL